MDKDEKEEDAKVLIDPNSWFVSGITSIYLLQASGDHRYIAFLIQEAGSYWVEIRVRDLETREELSDALEWIKISGAAWYGNGFFYSRYPEPEAGMRLSEANEYHTVYYHRLGDDQSEDELIFRDDNAPKKIGRAHV